MAAENQDRKGFFGVYMWDHEYDSREWKAGSLEEIIIQYYTNVE